MERGHEKVIKVRVATAHEAPVLTKPNWIRVRYPTGDAVSNVLNRLKEGQLNTVCQEAACPNLPECFGRGTATFMILGKLCTRRCTFCDVAHGRPLPVDPEEPYRLAETVIAMGLKYVVITSVDRDDLTDGGAHQFAACIQAIHALDATIRVEILVPDYRGRHITALLEHAKALPHVFSHNIETVPRLYRAVRPGADYQHSLTLLKHFKEQHPTVGTKSGIMLGLGETDEEVQYVFRDLRDHHVDRLTIGQYLPPSQHHQALMRYVTPEQFSHFKHYAETLHFQHVVSGPMVRSSYRAEEAPS
jgi:lipoyl synthase